MVPGLTDTDYYAGKVKGSVPEQAAGMTVVDDRGAAS